MRNSKSIFKEIGTIVMIGLFLPIGQVFAQAVKNPKVVLVTGAASGIGKATAIAFVKNGYLTYATDKDTTNMQDLEKMGCRIRYITYNNMREKFLKQSNAMFDPQKRTYGILTAEKVANVILKSARKKKPKTRYKIGALAKITPVIHSILSDRAFDKFMLRQFKVSTKKGESFYNAKSN